MRRVHQILLTTIHYPATRAQLLTFLPAQDGGLFPVAMGLFHPNVELRRLTVELLKRIEMLPAGQALFESLNEMVLLAFERNRHLVKDRRAK